MTDLSMKEIEQRIARLKGQVPPPTEELESRPAAPEPPFDFAGWLAKQIQPENETPDEPFVVGQRRNEYGEWIALPPFVWPNPGGPMTEEVYRAHGQEQSLLMDANSALCACVRYLAGKLRYGAEWWNDQYSGTPCELFDRRWAYLAGLWKGRGITAPSDSILESWARTLNKEIEAKARRANAKA